MAETLYRIKQEFNGALWETSVQTQWLGIWWKRARWYSLTKSNDVLKARDWIKSHKDRGPHYVT